VTPVDAVFALLFVADVPVTAAELSASSGFDRPPVEEALRDLQARLDKDGPIHLIQLAGGYQLATKPEYAQMISRLLLPQRQRLSRSLMEVLAIVAYRQPVTLSEIEAVRGVDCGYGIRALLERRLVKEAGRRATPGRPIEYGTTEEFLHQFKMNALNELPALTELPLALAPSEADQLEQSATVLESRYNQDTA
jgi:segregation and condensation protein B